MFSQGGFARSRVDRARHRDHPGAGGRIGTSPLDAAAPTSVSRLRTTLLPADQRRFGIEMAPFVSGPLPVDLTYTTAAEAPPRWWRRSTWPAPSSPGGAGLAQAGERRRFLAVRGDVTADRPDPCLHFELAAGDLAAGGKVTLVDGAVSVLDLRRLSLGESNLSVTARRREDGGYAVTIDGERLNLAGAVNRSEKTRLRPRRLNLWRAGPIGPGLRHAAQRREPARDVVGQKIRAGQYCWPYAARRPAPVDGTRRRYATDRQSDRRFLGPVWGGKPDYRRPIGAWRGRADGGLSGRLKVSDFTVTEAPILARILSLASFTGIVQAPARRRPALQSVRRGHRF